jgi:hypothetical protein
VDFPVSRFAGRFRLVPGPNPQIPPVFIRRATPLALSHHTAPLREDKHVAYLAKKDISVGALSVVNAI